MAIDFDFISAVLKKGKGGLRMVREANFSDTWLDSDKAKIIWKYITDFQRDHGELPAFKTINKYYPGELNTEIDQDLPYFLSELRKREIFKLTALLATDISELYNSADENTLQTAEEKAAELVLHASKRLRLDLGAGRTYDVRSMKDAKLEAYEQAKQQKGLTGIPTAWPILTEATRGWQRQGLYMFAAKSGGGKSFNLLEQFKAATLAGFVPLFVSEEMKALELAVRLDAQWGGLDYGKILRGALDEEQEEKYDKILDKLGSEKLPFYINEGGGSKGLDYVFDLVDELQPDILFIDNIYLYGQEYSVKEFAPMAHNLKRKAFSANIPVVFTTQLNDEGKAMYARAFEHIVTRFMIQEHNEANMRWRIYDAKKRDSKGLDFLVHADFENGNFSQDMSMSDHPDDKISGLV